MWHVTYIADDYTVLYTDGQSKFEDRAWIMAATFLKFSVKTCGNARIALSTMPQNITVSYIITLRGDSNTKTSIEKVGPGGFVKVFTTDQVIYILLYM